MTYNNRVVVYRLCKKCANDLAKKGLSPSDIVRTLVERRGFMCPSCGTTAEEFNKSFRFGCAECYANMRGLARAEIARVQNGYCRYKAELPTRSKARVDASDPVFSGIVLSSRVRLARNSTLGAFPDMQTASAQDCENSAKITACALSAASECADPKLVMLKDVGRNERLNMVERHQISPELVDNALRGLASGVILEKPQSASRAEYEGLSVMLNEEDQIRVQVISGGLNLRGAYKRAKDYSMRLAKILPLAYDREFGWLSACPTNVGTGMRASTMLFLPALRLIGVMDDAVARFRDDYGLTMRGVYGEGSTALGDV